MVYNDQRNSEFGSQLQKYIIRVKLDTIHYNLF